MMHEKKSDFPAFDRFRTIWDRKKGNWLVYSIPLVSTLSRTRQLPRFMACTSWWCISQFVPDKNHRSLTRGGCQMHHGAATVHHPSVELRNQGFSRCKPWISDTTLRKPGLSTDMLLQNDHWVSTRMGHPKIPVVVDHHLPGSSLSKRTKKGVSYNLGQTQLWQEDGTCMYMCYMPHHAAFICLSETWQPHRKTKCKHCWTSSRLDVLQLW